MDTVGQGPIALAVGAGGGCLDIFTLIYHFSSLSPSLRETARYGLKYCLKEPLNPKQPTNQLNTCREPKATNKGDIANTFGETFLNKSSSRHYSDKFRPIKINQEKQKLNFKSCNNEKYNNAFTLSELVDAFKISHDTATGPDEVHYQMLKHLPDWLVGCFGFNGPLRQYFSLYRAVSQREGEREEKG